MHRRRRAAVLLLALLVAVAGLIQVLQVEAETPDPALAENVEHVTSRPGFTGGHVVTEGKRLYVGAFGAGMRIYDIRNPANPVQIGEYHVAAQPEHSDNHLHVAHADAVPDAIVMDGREIAVLNGTRRVTQNDQIRTDHTDFFDATDPANLKQLWTFVGQSYGEAHNGDIVDVRRLWLPSGGTGCHETAGATCVKHRGLRIFDLSPLLKSPPEQPAELVWADPVRLWESSPYRRGRPVGPEFTHTHDITVYTDYPVAGLGPRDIVLLAEGGTYTNNAGNTGSIFVIDITDPRNPVALLRWTHAPAAGHHPIRYFHEAQFLAGDPRVMLVTDEDLHAGAGCLQNAGGVTAVRLSDDLTQATELSEWFIPTGTPAPICSVHVFSSHGNFVFLGSYNAGLQVVDYKNPAAPKRAGQYIAAGTTAWGALYHKGYVYIGDMTRGLDVVRWTGGKKANKVKNGSFESSADGRSPDSWSSSGPAGYVSGGSDGEKAVSSSGGSWTSAPIDVVAGRSYGFSVDVARGGGTLVIEQLDATGLILSSVNRVLFATGDGSFQMLSGSFTPAPGATQVRVRLEGSLLGETTLDNVQLWEE